MYKGEQKSQNATYTTTARELPSLERTVHYIYIYIKQTFLRPQRAWLHGQTQALVGLDLFSVLLPLLFEAPRCSMDILVNSELLVE